MSGHPARGSTNGPALVPGRVDPSPPPAGSELPRPTAAHPRPPGRLAPLLRTIGTRVVYLLIVLFAVSVLVFLLMDLMPGDPAEIIAGNVSDPQIVESIRQQLGLDKPIVVRYLDWLGNALTGDLGRTFGNNQAIGSIIANALPITLQLMVMAEVIALVVAIPLAIIAAMRRDSGLDRSLAVIVFGIQAIPNYVFSLVLIIVLAVSLKWLPAIGYVNPLEDPWGNARSMIIPSLALALSLLPIYLRVLRNEMIRTLQEDFILVARAVGLTTPTIVFRYALRPSLPTLVTVVGINIGMLMGGTVLIEIISGLPGIGTVLYTAINAREYLLVQAVILLVASAYVIANFVVDILYTVLDPRVRAL